MNHIGQYFLATCMIITGGFIALQSVVCNPGPFVAFGVGAGLVYWGFRLVRPQQHQPRRGRRN